MGGKSSSKSSNTTTNINETKQVDNRIGASDDGMVATSGGSITNYNLTEDVIQAALEESFGFGEDIAAGAFDVVAQSIEAVEETNAEEMMKLAELTKSTIENSNAAKANFDTLMKAGTAIAAVFLLTRVMK